MSAEALVGDLPSNPSSGAESSRTRSASPSFKGRGETVWLDVEGDDGPSLLAELAQIIDKHGHAVKVLAFTSIVKVSGTL